LSLLTNVYLHYEYGSHTENLGVGELLMLTMKYEVSGWNMSSLRVWAEDR